MWRLFRYVRDTFRILSGRDSEVRDMTINIQKEIALIRESQSVQEKVCEETALAHLRSIVKEMKDLEKHLSEAETAAIEQVNKIAKEAKEHLEADLKAEEELLIQSFADNKEAIIDKILKFDDSQGISSESSSALKEASIDVGDSNAEVKKEVPNVLASNQQ